MKVLGFIFHIVIYVLGALAIIYFNIKDPVWIYFIGFLLGQTLEQLNSFKRR